MRSVRIGQVSGSINLVRFHLPQQIHDNIYIFFSQRVLFHGTRFIERQIQKMYSLRGDTHKPTSGQSLCRPQGRLELQHLFRFTSLRFQIPNRLLHLLVPLAGHSHILGEQVSNIHHLVQVIIKHGNVPRCLINRMHLMPLFHQTGLRSSHRDHVIIRMRAENQHPFRVRMRSLRTG